MAKEKLDVDEVDPVLWTQCYYLTSQQLSYAIRAV